MRIPLVFIFMGCFYMLLASGAANSKQLYKCTDKSGQVAFQGFPCAASQGASESIIIKSTNNPNYIPPTYPAYQEESGTEEYEEALIRAEKRQNKRHDKVMADYDKKVCDRYKGYLQDELDRWEIIEQNGYKQWQKDNYTIRIKSATREMEAQCQ